MQFPRLYVSTTMTIGHAYGIIGVEVKFSQLIPYLLKYHSDLLQQNRLNVGNLEQLQFENIDFNDLSESKHEDDLNDWHNDLNNLELNDKIGLKVFSVPKCYDKTLSFIVGVSYIDIDFTNGRTVRPVSLKHLQKMFPKMVVDLADEIELLSEETDFEQLKEFVQFEELALLSTTNDCDCCS